MKPHRRHPSAGTTLIELMVAVTILGIVAVGIVGSFATVSKSIQYSKTRSLATNLAQEQMQILKQKDFHKVLVTTATAYLSAFSPSIPYDPGYYPPESIREGGFDYTRYTYVQVAGEVSGNLQYFGSVADTGMKAMTVTVTWNQGGETKKVQVKNIIANDSTTMTNSILTGTISNSVTSAPIANATISMAENVGYSDITSSLGTYSISATAGSYTVYVQAEGYFTAYRSLSLSANSSTTQNFALVAMGSGTIAGTAWLNDHLVISQVVGSTQNASGFCQEYVELFNPTTYTWTINGNVDLKIQNFSDAFPTTISMTYNTNTVDPYSYYLFSNTSPVTAVGVSVVPDAVFSPSNAGYPDLIRVAGGDPCFSNNGNADDIQIADTATGNRIDAVGWTQTPRNPTNYEGVPYAQTIGLQDNEQFVRKTSTSGVSDSFGRAYDSGSNNVDITGSSPLTHPPRNSASTSTVIAGTPAIGAYISATDGLSSVTNAASFGLTPVALFQLTSVATGTWTVFMSSSGRTLALSTVVVTANSTTWIPNNVTSPTWPSNGYYAAILSESDTVGYVSGWVKSTLGSAISPAITVQGPGATVTASVVSGNYLLSLDPGVCDITANSGNQNSAYVSMSSQSVTVVAGQVTSGVDFSLSQGGRIAGFVTRDGINPFPGISVVAYNASGVAMDEDVSANDGYYRLVNLSTGPYTVEPVLGSGEAASPTSSVVTVTGGGLVTASTFTISGSYGYVRGSVTSSGDGIKTGVLIVCSTSTLPSGPPNLNSSTLSSGSVYTANSYEDGTYVLEVRGSTSTTYRVYAYYPTFSGTTPVVSSRSVSGVTVTQGVTTSGVNFSW